MQEPQFWDCYQLAGSKMLLDRDCAVQKSEAAKFYHQSCECNPVLRCVWEALPFLIVDVTFYRQQHLFQVRSQPPCSGKFACLESRPSLATCNCATVPVAKAKCYYCSSKLCLQFCPFETRSVQQMGPARTTILGLLPASRV